MGSSPQFSWILCGTAEQLAEKVREMREIVGNKIAGAEAHTHFADFIGPAKAVPLLQSPFDVFFSKL